MFKNKEPEVSTNRSSLFNHQAEISPSTHTTPEEQASLPAGQAGWSLVNGRWAPPTDATTSQAGNWLTYTL